MSWFWLTFINTNLFSLVNLVDKFFCAKKFKNTYSFAAIIYLASAIFILALSFFVDWSGLYGWPFFWALASGPIYFLMWILYWRALATTEVSRVVAIFNIAPIFNALLAAIFLNEVLSGSKWLAIFLIVSGAVLASWENKKNGKFDPVYLLVVLAAMVNAVGNVASKFATIQINALSLYPLSFLGSLPLHLWLLTKKEVSLEIKTNLSNKKTTSVILIRSLIAFIAICLFYLAMERGPISLISAVAGIGPLLVFIYSTAMSFFFPHLIKEEISCQALIQKSAAIILIVIGIILINQ